MQKFILFQLSLLFLLIHILSCSDPKPLVEVEVYPGCQPLSKDFFDIPVKEYQDLMGTPYLMLFEPGNSKIWWVLKSECIKTLNKIK